MKRITIYALFVAGLIALCGGCNSGIEPIVSDNCLTLTVSTPGMETKATINGVDALHENDVKSVYYFLYPAGETDVQPSLNGFFAGLNLTGPGATKTWTIPVSANTVSNELFPSGVRQCALYVIANPPAGLVSLLEGKPTLNQIRTAVFTTNLIGTQSSFVMMYDGVASLLSRTAGNAITGEAELKRVADKITVSAQAAQSYTDPVTGYEWTPMMEGLSVEFYNAFQKANFAGDFSSLTVKAEDDYFDVPAIRFGTATSQAASGPDDFDKYIANANSPVYTYPMAWEFADRYEPYLLFELPWTRTSTSTDEYGHTTTKDIIQNCYYKMMLNAKQMSSNCWYSITAKLEVLGSFSKTDPTQQYLYEDYMVLNWKDAFSGSNNNVDAEIKEARYLVVNQTDYTIFNQTKLSIPFATSHECDVVVTSATQAKLTTGTPTNYTTAAAGWFSFNGSVLEFNHSLNNVMGSTMDCTPYEIDITIQHHDNSSYSQTIHITQYPAVYVSEERNSGANNDSSTKGYTYVNGSQSDASSAPYGGIYGSYNDGTVNNPNMTLITVTQFSPEFDYIIGDPRTSYVHNLGNNDLTAANTDAASWSSNAPGGVGGDDRKLTYYYPTDPTKSNYIAPKIRVVSSYSRQPNFTSYEDALKRCASWQEDGYPAGRWRLPTEAEVRYIVTLSTQNFIKQIFYTNRTYFYAGGSVVNASTYSNSTSGDQLTRCVYDEWYWDEIDKKAGNTHSTKTFYWGDQPR